MNKFESLDRTFAENDIHSTDNVSPKRQSFTDRVQSLFAAKSKSRTRRGLHMGESLEPKMLLSASPLSVNDTFDDGAIAEVWNPIAVQENNGAIQFDSTTDELKTMDAFEANGENPLKIEVDAVLTNHSPYDRFGIVLYEGAQKMVMQFGTYGRLEMWSSNSSTVRTLTAFPPGSYHVSAEYDGSTFSAVVTDSSGVEQTVEGVFDIGSDAKTVSFYGWMGSIDNVSVSNAPEVVESSVTIPADVQEIITHLQAEVLPQDGWNIIKNSHPNVPLIMQRQFNGNWRSVFEITAAGEIQRHVRNGDGQYLSGQVYGSNSEIAKYPELILDLMEQEVGDKVSRENLALLGVDVVEEVEVVEVIPQHPEPILQHEGSFNGTTSSSYTLENSENFQVQESVVDIRFTRSVMVPYGGLVGLDHNIGGAGAGLSLMLQDNGKLVGMFGNNVYFSLSDPAFSKVGEEVRLQVRIQDSKAEIAIDGIVKATWQLPAAGIGYGHATHGSKTTVGALQQYENMNHAFAGAIAIDVYDSALTDEEFDRLLAGESLGEVVEEEAVDEQQTLVDIALLEAEIARLEAEHGQTSTKILETIDTLKPGDFLTRGNVQVLADRIAMSTNTEIAFAQSYNTEDGPITFEADITMSGSYNMFQVLTGATNDMSSVRGGPHAMSLLSQYNHLRVSDKTGQKSEVFPTIPAGTYHMKVVDAGDTLTMTVSGNGVNTTLHLDTSSTDDDDVYLRLWSKYTNTVYNPVLSQEVMVDNTQAIAEAQAALAVLRGGGVAEEEVGEEEVVEVVKEEVVEAIAIQDDMTEEERNVLTDIVFLEAEIARLEAEHGQEFVHVVTQKTLQDGDIALRGTVEILPNYIHMSPNSEIVFTRSYSTQSNPLIFVADVNIDGVKNSFEVLTGATNDLSVARGGASSSSSLDKYGLTITGKNGGQSRVSPQMTSGEYRIELTDTGDSITMTVKGTINGYRVTNTTVLDTSSIQEDGGYVRLITNGTAFLNYFSMSSTHIADNTEAIAEARLERDRLETWLEQTEAERIAAVEKAEREEQERLLLQIKPDIHVISTTGPTLLVQIQSPTDESYVTVGNSLLGSQSLQHPDGTPMDTAIVTLNPALSSGMYPVRLYNKAGGTMLSEIMVSWNKGTNQITTTDTFNQAVSGKYQDEMVGSMQSFDELMQLQHTDIGQVDLREDQANQLFDTSVFAGEGYNEEITKRVQAYFDRYGFHQDMAGDIYRSYFEYRSVLGQALQAAVNYAFTLRQGGDYTKRLEILDSLYTQTIRNRFVIELIIDTGLQVPSKEEVLAEGLRLSKDQIEMLLVNHAASMQQLRKEAEDASRRAPRTMSKEALAHNLNVISIAHQSSPGHNGSVVYNTYIEKYPETYLALQGVEVDATIPLSTQVASILQSDANYIALKTQPVQTSTPISTPSISAAAFAHNKHVIEIAHADSDRATASSVYANYVMRYPDAYLESSGIARDTSMSAAEQVAGLLPQDKYLVALDVYYGPQPASAYEGKSGVAQEGGAHGEHSIVIVPDGHGSYYVGIALHFLTTRVANGQIVEGEETAFVHITLTEEDMMKLALLDDASFSTAILRAVRLQTDMNVLVDELTSEQVALIRTGVRQIAIGLQMESPGNIEHVVLIANEDGLVLDTYHNAASHEFAIYEQNPSSALQGVASTLRIASPNAFSDELLIFGKRVSPEESSRKVVAVTASFERALTTNKTGENVQDWYQPNTSTANVGFGLNIGNTSLGQTFIGIAQKLHKTIESSDSNPFNSIFEHIVSQRVEDVTGIPAAEVLATLEGREDNFNVRFEALLERHGYGSVLETYTSNTIAHHGFVNGTTRLVFNENVDVGTITHVVVKQVASGQPVQDVSINTLYADFTPEALGGSGATANLRVELTVVKDGVSQVIVKNTGEFVVPSRPEVDWHTNLSDLTDANGEITIIKETIQSPISIDPEMIAPDFSVEQLNDGTSMKISWTPDSKFDGYKIYAYSADDIVGVRAFVSGTSNSITLNGFKPGNTYFFGLRGMKDGQLYAGQLLPGGSDKIEKEFIPHSTINAQEWGLTNSAPYELEKYAKANWNVNTELTYGRPNVRFQKADGMPTEYLSNHSKGNAIDIFFSGDDAIANGDRLRNLLLEYHAQLGISAVIWQGKKYELGKDPVNANGHYDHLHIEFSNSGLNNIDFSMLQL